MFSSVDDILFGEAVMTGHVRLRGKSSKVLLRNLNTRAVLFLVLIELIGS